LKSAEAGARLSLARVRERLVGIPISGAPPALFRVKASDGFLTPDQTIDFQVPEIELARTVIVLGCDPALSLLGGLLARAAPGLRAHTVFASSRKALFSVNEGDAHIAGIHYHGLEAADGNIEAVRALSPALDCLAVAFSWQEEGFMVAAGNPLDLRRAEDIARARFVNREEGAALRKLLDMQLARSGLPASEVRGHGEEVYSHSEGALRVARGTADAALGLRIVAESFGLDFVPLAVTRCDLVIPSDLRDHAGVAALLDVLQSASLRKELAGLPGYDPADTGKIILG
jgi:molybdate-binding protein